MRHDATHTITRTARPRPAVIVLLTVVLGLLMAGPAAAQFVDEQDADATAEQSDGAQPADQDAPADEDGSSSGGDGFVGDDGHEADDGREAAPVGGVDAGFGGAADQAGDARGPGAPHAVALTLLVLAVAGHAALARRPAQVRG